MLREIVKAPSNQNLPPSSLGFCLEERKRQEEKQKRFLHLLFMVRDFCFYLSENCNISWNGMEFSTRSGLRGSIRYLIVDTVILLCVIFITLCDIKYGQWDG